MSTLRSRVGHDAIVDWVESNRAEFADDLVELVAIDTCSPHEQVSHAWLRDYFGRLGAGVTDEPRHPDLSTHPAANRNGFCAMPASDRSNLRIEFPRRPGLPRTLFSAHTDVVPAAADYPGAFTPTSGRGAVHGRGAADTKGNIIMLAAALRCVSDLDLVPCRNVSVDLVCEEEIGGNGALSTIMHGREVDEVVVLEPTGLEVFHGHRGCLEFTVRMRGRASHMGGDGVSAIDAAVDYIVALRLVEARLIAEARSDANFIGWERPTQINVGRVEGGEWHGSIPAQATIGGAFGFLPRYTLDDVRAMLTRLLMDMNDPWLVQHADIAYEGIRNGAYLGDSESLPAQRLRAAARSVTGRTFTPRAWSVSCDARLYHEYLGVPTVIFGAGQLAQAHSSSEYLDLDEWADGVRILVRFLTTEAAAAGDSS